MVDMHSILRHDFALNTILFLLVSVYDVLTGKIVSKLQGHRACVRDVAWHPYEPVITTSSWDGSVGCWTHRSSVDETSNKARQEESQSRKFTNVFL